MAIPIGITADDVRDGIRRLEAGEPHGFGRSAKLDVVVDGKRYPPKAVLALATYRILGRSLISSDFVDEKDSSCIRILERLGFIVDRKAPAGWIFQCNPDKFDLEGYLATTRIVRWTIGQKHLQELMQVGQPVFFWMAQGAKNHPSGIVGFGELTDTPKMQREDEASRAFYKGEADYYSTLRVNLKISSVRTDKDRILKREWLEEDPILRRLPILRQAAGTNFPITEECVTRLRSLDERTGKDFNAYESAVGLLVYCETYGSKLSKRPGSPVANAALRIGRPVASVYIKVLNFRSLDPRDPRDGLRSSSKVDRDIWHRFYDPDVEAIDLNALLAMLGTNESAPVELEETLLTFDEARDDDVGRITKVARRVRQGQSRFRANLLKVHGGRCAVTGTNLESVLEACHISEHATTGINQIGNGVLLRSDIHNLFDDGLITIEASGKIRLAPEIMKTEYSRYDGTLITNRDSKYPIDVHRIEGRNSKLGWLLLG